MFNQTKSIVSKDIIVISNNNKITNSHNKTNNISNNIPKHSPPNFSFQFTSEKAGMQGLDREEIDRIIYEATKDSTITKKKQEDLEKIKLFVEDYKVKLDNLYKNEFLLDQNRKLAETRIRDLKKERTTDRIWLHLDMDMFYAAIEIRDKPELKDKPVAVGNERMISTSNYIARKFGVRSAMPGFIGKKLCKDLIFINCNFNKYETDSKKIMKILKIYDADMEIMGLDEAYLDLTQYCSLNYITNENEIRELVKEIKNKVLDETQLTSSVGIACNKMLAKICSDIQKPDGLYILPNDFESIENFMKNLKVRKVPFIGEKLEKKLNFLNIFTCQDVLEREVDLYHLFSENQFDFLFASCYGIGPCHHEEVRESISKSISCSETFKLTNDLDFLSKQFRALCKKLYINMTEMSVIGKTITIETTDKNERHTAKSLSLIKRFETESELINNGWTLFKSMWDANTQIRLLRVKISSLQQVNPQTLKKKEENQIKHWIGKLNLSNNTNNNIETNAILNVNRTPNKKAEKRSQSASNSKASDKKEKKTSMNNSFGNIEQMITKMRAHPVRQLSVNNNIEHNIGNINAIHNNANNKNQNTPPKNNQHLKRKSDNSNNSNSNNKNKKRNKKNNIKKSSTVNTGPIDLFIKK